MWSIVIIVAVVLVIGIGYWRTTRPAAPLPPIMRGGQQSGPTERDPQQQTYTE
jgi:hypothetical protein